MKKKSKMNLNERTVNLTLTFLSPKSERVHPPKRIGNLNLLNEAYGDTVWSGERVRDCCISYIGSERDVGRFLAHLDDLQLSPRIPGGGRDLDLDGDL